MRRTGVPVEGLDDAAGRPNDFRDDFAPFLTTRLVDFFRKPNFVRETDFFFKARSPVFGNANFANTHAHKPALQYNVRIGGCIVQTRREMITVRNFLRDAMSGNPYEYHDEHAGTPPVANAEYTREAIDASAYPFPKTPFEISLRYRGRLCTLTVFGDHLIIEGEKLPEPIRVERNEPFRFRFWSPIRWGDFVFICRKKKYKFKVRGESQIFLKLGWLHAWGQCLVDSQEAAEKAEHKSQDLILFLPKVISLIIGVEFLLFTIGFAAVYVFASPGSPTRTSIIPCFLSAFAAVYSYVGLSKRNRLGLWPIPFAFTGFMIITFGWVLYEHFFSSQFREGILRLFIYCCFTSCFFATVYYLPYRQLKRLDDQIRETRNEDDLPV